MRPVRCLVVAILAVAACGDGLSTEPTSPLVLLTSPADTLTAIGATVQLTAEVRRRGGEPRALAGSWRSLDTTVLVVDGEGVVTAVANGSAQVVARDTTGLSGRMRLTVRQRPALMRIELLGPAAVLMADSVRAVLEVTDANGVPVTELPVTWSVSDAALATVRSDGWVIGRLAGAVRVRAALEDRFAEADVTVREALLVQSLFHTSPWIHFCVVMLDGMAACGGWLTPTLDPVSPSRRFGSFTAGDNHACGTDLVGKIWCNGNNTHGQTGGVLGGRYDTLVATIPDSTFRFVMASDHDFNCAITVGGSAGCWGHNDLGQLGNNQRRGNTPAFQALVGVTSLDTVDVGALHACGLLSGQAFCWGAWGRFDSTAVPVPGGHTFRTLSAGISQTCAVDTADAVWCWGFEYDTDANPDGNPLEVAGLPPMRMVSVAWTHACGVSRQDEVWCWGAIGVPVERLDLPFRPMTVAAGGSFAPGHTCAITELRSVMCWSQDTRQPYRILLGQPVSPPLLPSPSSVPLRSEMLPDVHEAGDGLRSKAARARGEQAEGPRRR